MIAKTTWYLRIISPENWNFSKFRRFFSRKLKLIESTMGFIKYKLRWASLSSDVKFWKFFENFKKFLSVEHGQITLKIKKWKIIIKGTILSRIQFWDRILRWLITKIVSKMAISSENSKQNDIFGCKLSSNSLYSWVYTCWAWEIQFGRRIEPF